MNDTLTRVPGFAVGHWDDPEARTGCTVILCPPGGAVASGSFIGPSPGTREGVLLAPEKAVERVHALLLTGGSAFGLAAADGVMRFLEERGEGYPTPAGPVPIVPAAVIYDLAVGSARVRPGADQGHAAARAASGEPVLCGPVGAGCGATVGKFLGPAFAAPGGLGSAYRERGGVGVGALAVVNAVGSVVGMGSVLAGPTVQPVPMETPDQGGAGRPAPYTTVQPVPMETPDQGGAGRPAPYTAFPGAYNTEHPLLSESLLPGTNTTLVAVATAHRLTKAACRTLADAAQTALARCLVPSHTPFDGDSAFVLSSGSAGEADPLLLHALTQDAVADAVRRAVER